MMALCEDVLHFLKIGWNEKGEFFSFVEVFFSNTLILYFHPKLPVIESGNNSFVLKIFISLACRNTKKKVLKKSLSSRN